MARPIRKTRSQSTTDTSTPSHGSETIHTVAESQDSVPLSTDTATTPTDSMPSGPPMDSIEAESNYSTDSSHEEVLASEHEEEIQVVSSGPASSIDIHQKQGNSIKPESQSLSSPSLPPLPSPAEIETKMKALVKTLDDNTSTIASNFKLNSAEVTKLAFKSGDNIIDYFSSLDDYDQDCVVPQAVIIQVTSKILNVTELNQLAPNCFILYLFQP